MESPLAKTYTKRICYIDDSKTSAFVTKKILLQAGYACDHFPDAESAIEAILDRDYDIVITDLMISDDGGVNGDDLITIIRRSGHPQKSLIPIIVVTSASDESTHQELYAVGADAVMVKPLTPQQLAQTVKNIEGKTRAPKATSTQKPAPMAETKREAVASDVKPIKKEKLRADAAMLPPDIAKKPKPDKPDDAVIPVLTESITPKKKTDFSRNVFFDERAVGDDKHTVTRRNIRPKTTTVDIPLVEGIDNSIAESIADIIAKEEAKPTPVEAKPVVEPVKPTPTSNALDLPLFDKTPSKVSFDDLVKMYEKDETPPPAPTPSRWQETAPEIAPEPKRVIEEQPARKDEEHNPLLDLLDRMEQHPPSNHELPVGGFKLPSFSFTPKTVRVLLVVLALALGLPPIVYVVLSENAVTVDVYSVTQGPIYESISVPGRVVSNKQVNVTAFFPGQITTVLVKEGDTVKKGQVLARMDDREVRTKVNRAEAQRISTQESVAAAAKTVERLQKALNLGAVSRQMVEDAEGTWKSLSAKQSLAEEELKEAKLMLERIEITAPFDGVVSTLNAQSGQFISPPEPVVKLVDTNNIEIELKVDAADSNTLREGQVVILSSDAFPGKTWNGTVIRISTTANRDTTTNLLSVFTSLGKDAPPLKVGQQVDGEIRTAVNNRALLVPFEAIKTINGQTMVAVDVNGRAHYVPIATGIESMNNVEVTQGLTLGQVVLLPGGLPLEEGQKVITAHNH